MEKERVSLTIEGRPGVEVKVFPKDHEDSPPPPPYTGQLDTDGRLTISIPPAHYSIVSQAHETTAVELTGGGGEQTVRLNET
jgi:hypothetical protein